MQREWLPLFGRAQTNLSRLCDYHVTTCRHDESHTTASNAILPPQDLVFLLPPSTRSSKMAVKLGRTELRSASSFPTYLWMQEDNHKWKFLRNEGISVGFQRLVKPTDLVPSFHDKYLLGFSTTMLPLLLSLSLSLKTKIPTN